ncbi:TPA: hypothetical protein ACXNE8_002300 [Pseudomonas aeruginosa]
MAYRYLTPRSEKGALRAYVRSLMRIEKGNNYYQLNQKTVSLIGKVFSNIKYGGPEDLKDLQVTLEECLAFVMKERQKFTA